MVGSMADVLPYLSALHLNGSNINNHSWTGMPVYPVAMPSGTSQRVMRSNSSSDQNFSMQQPTTQSFNMNSGRHQPHQARPFQTTISPPPGLTPQIQRTNHASSNPLPESNRKSSLFGLPLGEPSNPGNVFMANNQWALPTRPESYQEEIQALTSTEAYRMKSWPDHASNCTRPIGTKSLNAAPSDDIDDDSDDDDVQSLHPNKFPTILENHKSPECCYRRQPVRSGPRTKTISEKVVNPLGTNPYGHEIRQKTIKYYQKDLVRYCVCGEYEDQSGLLTQGRTNDCKGYEIHYSQKCKWKAYTDFYTKRTVLIRLCKCYKPHH